jgi:protein TonB
VRRLQQSSAGLSSALFGRLFAAVACSAALHVFLIYGFSLPAGSGRVARTSVVHARLAAPPLPAGPRGAKRPERDRVSDPAPVAAALAATAAGAEAQVAAPPANATATNNADAAAPAATDFADPVPYAASELDVYPRALAPIVPDYPQAVREARVAGFVTLQVVIDEAGRVVDTSVVDAAPEGVFERVAQQTLANAAFYPAQKNGRTVRCRLLVRVEFDPDAAQPGQ